ncbi:MAG: NTP transferase domain-containing protein [Lachnospiraceae bacterium]|nr:NTP transferase domain-containing protein [Lachnospiraceae bacterium]
MKVVILAGGMPSTLTDEREKMPKPMVEIGENPILWHIMKKYASQGFHEFIVCAGYKIDMIKDYFKDFYIYQSDITVDLLTNTIKIHKNISEDWKVTVVDTGLYSATGLRVSQAEKYIDGDSCIVTYGDCLDDIDINEVVRFHEQRQKLATMVVARPSGRHSLLALDGEGNYLGKKETMSKEAWTNTGTYVLEKRAFKFMTGNYSLENQLLERLAERNQIDTYQHEGFWSPIETKRDFEQMQNLWNAGAAPWKSWQEG